MSKGPGLFSDIGKKAKDPLTKDYSYDQKSTFSTHTAAGLVMTNGDLVILLTRPIADMEYTCRKMWISIDKMAHDERGSAGQGGRSFIRRPYERGRRVDPRERFSEKPREALASSDRKPRDDKAQERPSNNVWRHDGYYELEAEAPQPFVRKRPAFSETKLPPVDDATGADVHANDNPNQPDQSQNSGARKPENRGSQDLHGLEELNRQYSEPEGRNMRDERGGSFRLGGGTRGRDRYDRRYNRFDRNHDRTFGGGTRGRDRYDRRYNRFDRNQDRTVGPRVEKWKHDLFDEANRSPPKNDEDQIAKIEALLAL